MATLGCKSLTAYTVQILLKFLDVSFFTTYRNTEVFLYLYGIFIIFFTDLHQCAITSKKGFAYICKFCLYAGDIFAKRDRLHLFIQLFTKLVPFVCTRMFLIFSDLWMMQLVTLSQLVFLKLSLIQSIFFRKGYFHAYSLPSAPAAWSAASCAPSRSSHTKIQK